jgi:uncharacterized protein (DUF1778 family)
VLGEDELMALIRMSAEGFDAFLSVIAAPATPVPEIVELARRPAPWDISGKPASRS